MHEWLVIIVLLIIGILLDGIRRMRQARRNSLRMILDAHEEIDHDGLQDRSGELPNGGARVVNRDQEEKAEHLNGELENIVQVNSSPVSKPSPIDQQMLNLEEGVPMLMDSVASIESKLEPKLGADLDSVLGKKLKKVPEIVKSSVNEPLQKLSSKKQPLQKNPFKKPLTKAVSLHEPKNQPEEVLILHIEAADTENFHGEDLLTLILSQGLRYGEMNIFHRHIQEGGEGPILFSMANMVTPGVFDLTTFDTLLTPGISLFLRLPMADYNSINAFEMMLVTAKTLADELGGEVNDDQHSVMTKQTVEHYRERIRNFSLRQQLLERA